MIWKHACTMYPSDVHVESPVFSSPKGAQPATKWTLAILSGDCSPRKSIFDREVLPIDHQYLSIELRRQRAFNSTSRAIGNSQVASDSSIDYIIYHRRRKMIW